MTKVKVEYLDSIRTELKGPFFGAINISISSIGPKGYDKNIFAANKNREGIISNMIEMMLEKVQLSGSELRPLPGMEWHSKEHDAYKKAKIECAIEAMQASEEWKNAEALFALDDIEFWQASNTRKYSISDLCALARGEEAPSYKAERLANEAKAPLKDEVIAIIDEKVDEAAKSGQREPSEKQVALIKKFAAEFGEARLNWLKKKIEGFSAGMNSAAASSLISEVLAGGGR